MKPRTPAEYAAYAKKTVAALVGAAMSAVALGIVPDPYDGYVQVAIAFLTALGVYTVRNTGTDPDPATSVADETAVEEETAPVEPAPAEEYEPRHAEPLPADLLEDDFDGIALRPAIEAEATDDDLEEVRK